MHILCVFLDKNEQSMRISSKSEGITFRLCLILRKNAFKNIAHGPFGYPGDLIWKIVKKQLPSSVDKVAKKLMMQNWQNWHLVRWYPWMFLFDKIWHFHFKKWISNPRICTLKLKLSVNKKVLLIILLYLHYQFQLNWN